MTDARTTRSTIEERYAAASHASDLRLRLDRPCHVDILIATGWSETKIGGALLHLRNRYDATRTRRAATAGGFMIPGQVGHKQAAREAREANLVALSMIVPRLPEFERVTNAVLSWAVCSGITTRTELKVIETLGWWLHRVCGECGGTKFISIPGTGRLSAKHCRECRGAGERTLPHGQDGMRLVDFMDRCTQRALSEIKARLRG